MGRDGGVPNACQARGQAGTMRQWPVSRAAPALHSERLKPPQTQSETGAVKFPHTMPMHMHTRMHNHFDSWRPPGGAEALRKAVGGVSALTRRQRQPPQVPHCAPASETHGRRCTVRDMRHEVGAEPLDHRTGAAGIETGEACQRTSQPPQPLAVAQGGGGGVVRGLGPAGETPRIGSDCHSQTARQRKVWPNALREGGGGAKVERGGGYPPPLCDIPSGGCFFTGPWTVTRSSLRMLRRVAAFCRPLRPVLLPVSFPRSRSPVVGVVGLCWMWRDVPFAR